jgi:UDP-N-acetylmuramate dehydrogenase
MMAAARSPGFAQSLPASRGRVQADAPLAPFTWFRAGGAAEVLVRPADADDLAAFLRDLPNEVPVQVIGACSNLIVRDGGLPGVTIRLARGFSAITPEPGNPRSGAPEFDGRESGAPEFGAPESGAPESGGRESARPESGGSEPAGQEPRGPLRAGLESAGPEPGSARPCGIVAGAAALDVTVAEHAAAAGLTGLEFLSGIPGSIGGAVAMNAGAYGGEIAQVLDWAEIVTRSGEQRRLLGPHLAFAYRHAALPAGAIVTRVRLRATPGAPPLIAARMADIKANREASQPIRARTGGSTFRNPDGMKAWELIEAAGCRGLIRGGAMVSEKHCNFLINTATATAADIEGLGEEVRRRVLAATGVTLEWEIRRIGVPAGKTAIVAGHPRDGWPAPAPEDLA